MKQPFKFYMHDGPGSFRFEVSGILDRDGAARLEQSWRTASSVIGDRKLVIDLTFLTGADEHGRALLLQWRRAGAWFISNSDASRALAQEIFGEVLPEPPADLDRESVPRRAWNPVGGSLIAIVAKLWLLGAFLFAAEAYSATLKPETVTAWNDYVSAMNAKLHERVRQGGSFLWALENSERAAKVHRGEIVVNAAPGPNPRRVPGGLIHHWIGAMFLPDFKLDDVLAVTRDYDHYEEFYRPSVLDSKTIDRRGPNDRFTMLLMNKAFFLKTALDADYQATNVRLDDRRSYSVSSTTRVQEIEDYGEPDQHRLPEGEGGGYIWKLYSVARFEQSEGGVYVELEALALSRDIPAMARFLVEPIVRHVSRNSLFTSLEQTEEALRGTTATIARRAAEPAGAGRLPALPASLPRRSSAFASNH